MTKVILLILILSAGAGVFLYKYNQVNPPIPDFYTSPNPSFGYEDCVRSEGSKISDTYPKTCQTTDLVTYFQDQNAPIDTTAWKKIDAGLGFSFLCPEQWDCRKYDENSFTLYNPNYGISAFQIYLITPDNFQQSLLRHPSYTTPLAWYNDLKAKNKNAVKVVPSTIESVAGTDGQRYPSYAGYNLDEMITQEATEGGGLAFLKDESDTDVLIPLNDQDLILVIVSPNYFYENPLFKEVIRSITPG